MSEIKRLADLVPDGHNANRGTARGAKIINRSISENGFGRPILLDKAGRIIGGNKTIQEAADVFGIDAPVRVVQTDGKEIIAHQRTDLDLSDPNPNSTARKLAYSDNLSSHFSFSLDPDIVMADIEAGFDFEAIDITLPDLGEMLEGAARELLRGNGNGKDAEPKVDKAAELQKVWNTAVGQIWTLGNHRLAVGDCTDRAVVEAVMRGEKFDLMVTDPPYGVDYEGGRNPISNVPREKLKGDSSPALYDTFLSVWKDYRAEKGVLYIWFADRGGKPVYTAIEGAGFTIRALIIWNKIDPHYGNFMAQYLQKHEPCLYCVNGSTNWYGPTNEVTVWDIKQPNINEYHPTQKPLECMARPMGNSSKEGDIVVDPFSGSGTTLIAAENLGRKCRAIEIDPGYAAVAIQRWVDLTGQTPKLLTELTL